MATMTDVASYNWVHGSTDDAVIGISQPDALTRADAALVIAEFFKLVGDRNLSGWCSVGEIG
ncbi:hypothetical protein MCERE10_02048 [Burkholderiaceae bacterium]